MGALLRMEMRRALGNRFFIIALVIGCALAVIGAVRPITLYLTARDAILTEEYLAYKNMFQFALTSAWARWLPLRATEATPNLFFFAAPLLVAFAYSWSYRSDQLGGYAQSVMVRAPRMRYYAAKACATFVAGGLVVAVPLLLNFIVLACFIPLQPPDIVYKLYTGVSTNIFLSGVFFTNPPLFMAVRFAIDFALAGLWAAAVLAFSLFVRNRVAIVAVPYLALIVVKYVSENLYSLTGTFGYNLTIIDHLKAFGDSYVYNGWALAADAAMLAVVAVALPLIAKKRDVL